jgi:hypothetical protein
MPQAEAASLFLGYMILPAFETCWIHPCSRGEAPRAREYSSLLAGGREPGPGCSVFLAAQVCLSIDGSHLPKLPSMPSSFLSICHPRLPGDQATPSFEASGQAPRKQPSTVVVGELGVQGVSFPYYRDPVIAGRLRPPLITGAHETAIMAAREG